MKKDSSFGVIPTLQKEGKTSYLLVRHREGHWAFPKGHAEAGETDIQAARRELAEETGIRLCRIVEDPVFAESYIIQKGGEQISKTVKYYLGFVENPDVTIQETEIADFAWLEYEAALERITFEEARRLLCAAQAHLQSLG